VPRSSVSGGLIVIEDRQFGEAAMKYLRDTLAGGDRLARHLLELPLERGLLHAYLPEEIDPEQISNFEADVFVGKELHPDDDWEAPALGLVLSCLRATPGSLAIWEGWPEELSREPPWKGALNYFWDNDGIWAVWGGPGGSRSESRTPYIYSLSDSDQEYIANAFDKARPYPTICVLTHLPGVPQLPASPFVMSRSLLASLAAHATHILVGAFDEQGLVIWSRTEA
jgi:hypothetical protein